MLHVTDTVWKQWGVPKWGRLPPHRWVLQQRATCLTKVLVFYCRMQWRWCVWLLYWWTVLWLVCLDRCIACFPRCQQHKQSCLLLLLRWDMLHLLHWMIPLAGKTEYMFVWSIRMIQVTKGGRTVYVKSSPPCTSFLCILLYQYDVPSVMCTCLCFTDPLIMCFLQHIMLSLRFIITCAIPDLPSWVATEMAKVEFARREACRRLSTTAASPTPDVTIPPPGLVIGRLVTLCQYITFQQWLIYVVWLGLSGTTISLMRQVKSLSPI